MDTRFVNDIDFAKLPVFDEPTHIKISSPNGKEFFVEIVSERTQETMYLMIFDLHGNVVYEHSVLKIESLQQLPASLRTLNITSTIQCTPSPEEPTKVDLVKVTCEHTREC